MTKDEADVLLANAITQHANVYGMDGGDDMLNHYAIVAHWVKQVDDGNSRYSVSYHADHIPEHIAEGLFRIGIQIARGQWLEERED